ncbi:transposase, partial [Mesobacillus maritimus]|uniref:transposase n=1 Tax=Mesobacillus maritimus TaxID=1643336 RepID=UPI00204117AB
EEYRKWFSKAKEIGTNEISVVKEELKLFYESLKSSGIPEMVNLIGTFQNWQTEILNSFVYNYSNGFLEGINNSTKVLKRNAYGFRSFE